MHIPLYFYISMCVYICMYIDICISIYLSIYQCICVCLYIYMYIYVYIRYFPNWWQAACACALIYQVCPICGCVCISHICPLCSVRLCPHILSHILCVCMYIPWSRSVPYFVGVYVYPIYVLCIACACSLTYQVCPICGCVWLLNSGPFIKILLHNHSVIYKIIFFFFRRSKRQRNFSLFYFASQES
jgi:hypothetical protein